MRTKALSWWPQRAASSDHPPVIARPTRPSTSRQGGKAEGSHRLLHSLVLFVLPKTIPTTHMPAHHLTSISKYFINVVLLCPFILVIKSRLNFPKDIIAPVLAVELSSIQTVLSSATNLPRFHFHATSAGCITNKVLNCKTNKYDYEYEGQWSGSGENINPNGDS
uniref:Uncharacterized protein n=1 Tax=Nelumbo nucifera TaxID=4432 RepID=A0A822XDM5_NELNU|nr:TPA_asm: hypothetical protein HUJ06_021007 [Nelumbo nucifera]